MVAIRRAESTDYSAIARLQADNWKKHYRGILRDDFLDQEVDQERTTLWYNRMLFPDKSQRVFIAEQDKKVSGFACIYLNEDAVYGTFLDNLHVNDQMLGKGIGKLLLQECAKEVQNGADSSKMYLWVFESNLNARSMYERTHAQLGDIIEKETVGGTSARLCRYTWPDVAVLL